MKALLTTSNGHGMGHLTRQLAVALAAGEDLDAALFSMSLALPVVAAHGLRGEYCPSHDRGWMPHVRWHRYVRDRLVSATREIGARVVTFDGVAPYLGIKEARSALPDVAFVWFRRGLWRPGYNTAALSASPFFDLVIEPGDLAAAADRGPTAGRTDVTRVPPITLLDVVDRPSRAEAAAELGIDPDRPTVLVTLGSGRLGEAVAPGLAALEALLEEPSWQVCLTRATIARQGIPLGGRDRVVELRGVYPLARYLPAFDAVVSAAGYNAVHEFLPAGLPTLLVPDANPSTDDQLARAQELARRGLVLQARPDRPADVAAAVRQLNDAARRADLRAACLAIPPEQRCGGARAAAGALLDLGRAFGGHRPGLGGRLRAADVLVRDAAMRAVGMRATALVRRAAGRTPPSGPPRRLRVRPVEEPPGTPPEAPPPAGVSSATPPVLLLTERITSELVQRAAPLEHLLPGSSPAYRQVRRRLAARYYALGRRPPGTTTPAVTDQGPRDVTLADRRSP